MKITIDGNYTKDKQDILKIFQNNFEEMYSLNYDALIDVLTEFKNTLLIEIVNKQLISDYNRLIEALDIICNDNPNITYICK